MTRVYLTKFYETSLFKNGLVIYIFLLVDKELGAIRDKIGPTSDVDKIFSKIYSQYVLFINKYS